MYNILVIGKDLPAATSFSDALRVNQNKIFCSVKSEKEAIQLQTKNVFCSTWNKSSAVSAHSFLIKAETSLEKISHIIFYYDSAYFCTKFELDKTDEISMAVDSLINSYLFSSSELLKRIDQKKEQITVSFIVRNHPSKFEISTSNSKNANILPASSIVSIGESCFETLAQNFATNVSSREYLTVFLAKCAFNNEIYKNDKQLASWILESFETLSNAKHHQNLKQATTWNKVGSKISTGFSLFGK